MVHLSVSRVGVTVFLGSGRTRRAFPLGGATVASFIFLRIWFHIHNTRRNNHQALCIPPCSLKCFPFYHALASPL